MLHVCEREKAPRIQPPKDFANVKRGRDKRHLYRVVSEFSNKLTIDSGTDTTGAIYGAVARTSLLRIIFKKGDEYFEVIASL